MKNHDIEHEASAPKAVELPPIPPDKADVIWEQWKYRHQFFWTAFYLATVTTAFISTLPLLKTEIVKDLGWSTLLFPVVGLVFGLFAKRLLDAEYKRLGAVGDSFSSSAWNYGARRLPPYRTDVGRSVGDLLRPAMRAALLGMPILSMIVVALLVQHVKSTKLADGAAKGSQPSRSETNRTSSSAGSLR